MGHVQQPDEACSEDDGRIPLPRPATAKKHPPQTPYPTSTQANPQPTKAWLHRRPLALKTP